jgi:uncharacterized protein YjbI with pentapeptide repeats
MKRPFHLSQVLFHPATLAVFSGVLAAVIGFLINLVSGGNPSQTVWIALSFAIVLSLALNAWQVAMQEKSGQQMMTLLQEMILQTYFLTVLTDKPEVSQMAQQRLSQVLTSLNDEQQVSMLKFFSRNGLPATFVGNALQGSTALAGADLQQMVLPQIHLEQALLSGANLSGANLSGAHLQEASLHRANLSGANLSQANLRSADLGATDLQGANLTGADLTGASLGRDKEGPGSSGLQFARGRRRDRPANLRNALLSHAHLREANLYKTILSGANVQEADLTKAILYEADLSGANVQGADLTEAVLYGADLSGADLRGADLTEAVLYGAILDGADVRSAKVTEEQLLTVRSSKNMKREP